MFKFGNQKVYTTQKESDDLLGEHIAALEIYEENKANEAFYALLADPKSHELYEAGGRWSVNWETMTFWVVALLGIVEGWGIAYEVLEVYLESE